MIVWCKGDLFKRKVDIQINAVNCVGVMGKGIAREFKKRYPDMYKDYKRACRKKLLYVGTLDIWDDAKIQIINFPTKIDWKDKSRYEYIEKGLLELHAYLKNFGEIKVAMPALGCNNGGLKWKKVKKMIRKHLKGLKAKIYVYRPMDEWT